MKTMNLQELEKYKDKLDSLTQRTEKCWWYLGMKNAEGRGVISLGGKTKSVRTMAWELYHHQEVPKDFMVKASCENGLCISPNHLELVKRAWPKKRHK
jgi:hypothetical protein